MYNYTKKWKVLKNLFLDSKAGPPRKFDDNMHQVVYYFSGVIPPAFFGAALSSIVFFMDGNHSMTWGWWKLRLRSPSRQKLLLADSCAVPQRRRTPGHLDEWNRICLGILLQIDCHIFFAQVHRTLMLSAIGVCQHTSFHHFNPHHLDRPTPGGAYMEPQKVALQLGSAWQGTPHGGDFNLGAPSKSWGSTWSKTLRVKRARKVLRTSHNWFTK